MSRSQSPASRARRPDRLRRSSALVLAAIAVVAVTSATATPAAVVAADGPANVLDVPLTDAALVDRGPGQPPDVLTLTYDPPNQSLARLELLRRGDGWSVQSEQTFDLPADFDLYNLWLIQVSPSRFVAIANTNAGTSELSAVSVDEAGGSAITVGEPVTMPIAAGGGGMTDVDGDGRMELVLEGTIDGYNHDCQRAAVAVLSVDGQPAIRRDGLLRLNTAAGKPIAYFSGVALGQWDDRPGTDLLANAYECGAAQQVPDTHHVIALRLADLKLIKDLPTSDVDLNIAQPLANPPAVIDVDHDGRNEALVTTSVGLRVIDPEDGWRINPFGTDLQAVVAALDEPDRTTGTSLIQLHSLDEPTGAGVTITRLTRVDGAIRTEETFRQPLSWMNSETMSAAIAYLRDSAWPDQPPVTMTDVDGDGCPDLLVPRVFIGCLATGAIEPAPTWTATRPLTVLESGLGRALLVAEGLDWYAGFSGPTAPSPAAVHPMGAWRSAMTSRFILAEVPIGDVGATPRIPTPTVTAPAIVKAATKDGHVDIERPAGARLLGRIVPYSQATPAPGQPEYLTPDGFLLRESTANEWYGATWSLNRSGNPAAPGAPGFGSGGGWETLDLRTNLSELDSGAPTGWVVTMAALDPSGTLSTPVQRNAVIDTSAPPLRVDVPFTSAPWPLTGALHGVSEPGASITLVGGPTVTAGPDGAFDVPLQLAPWPQTYDLTARDEAGNETASPVSVMGGVDLRGLPWPAIGVALVLVAVFLSSIRGVRSSPRQVRPLAVDVDDENATVIEELSIGRIDRRD